MDINKYMACFNDYSYNNPLYAKSTAHLLTGRLLVRYNKFLSFGSRTIDPRTSVTFFKPTASGGSSAFDFVKRIADAVGINIRIIDDVTDAGLIGTDEVTVDTETGEESHEFKGGILGDTGIDVVYVDEGTILFQKNPPQYQLKVRNFLQKALNPMGSATSIIGKKMAHSEGEVSPTQSLYIVSYFPPMVDSAVIESGFIQRSLLIPKFHSLDERKKNMFEDIDRWGIKSGNKDIDELIQSFKEMDIFIKNTPEFVFDTSIKEQAKAYIDDLTTMIPENSSPQLKEAGGSFIQFYVGRHFPTMSWHHAVWRGSSVVSSEDLQYVFNEAIMPIFKDVLFWLENKPEAKKASLIEISKEHVAKEIYEKLLLNEDACYEKVYVGRSYFVEELMKENRISKASAERVLSEIKTEKVKDGRAVFIKVL